MSAKTYEVNILKYKLILVFTNLLTLYQTRFEQRPFSRQTNLKFSSLKFVTCTHSYFNGLESVLCVLHMHVTLLSFFTLSLGTKLLLNYQKKYYSLKIKYTLFHFIRFKTHKISFTNFK